MRQRFLIRTLALFGLAPSPLPSYVTDRPVAEQQPQRVVADNRDSAHEGQVELVVLVPVCPVGAASDQVPSSAPGSR